MPPRRYMKRHSCSSSSVLNRMRRSSNSRRNSDKPWKQRHKQALRQTTGARPRGAVRWGNGPPPEQKWARTAHPMASDCRCRRLCACMPEQPPPDDCVNSQAASRLHCRPLGHAEAGGCMPQKGDLVLCRRDAPGAGSKLTVLLDDHEGKHRRRQALLRSPLQPAVLLLPSRPLSCSHI